MEVQNSTHVALNIQGVIGQFQLMEGYSLFHQLSTGSRAVWMNHFARILRFRLPCHLPLFMLILVSVFVDWNHVDHTHILRMRIQAFKREFERRKHPSGDKINIALVDHILILTSFSVDNNIIHNKSNKQGSALGYQIITAIVMKENLLVPHSPKFKTIQDQHQLYKMQNLKM